MACDDFSVPYAKVGSGAQAMQLSIGCQYKALSILPNRLGYAWPLASTNSLSPDYQLLPPTRRRATVPAWGLRMVAASFSARSS